VYHPDDPPPKNLHRVGHPHHLPTVLEAVRLILVVVVVIVVVVVAEVAENHVG